MGQASGEAGGRPGLRGPPLIGPLLARCPAPATSMREGQGSASAPAPSPGREESGPQPTAWEGAVWPWPCRGLPSPRHLAGAEGALSPAESCWPKPGGWHGATARRGLHPPSRRGPRGHLAVVQGWGQAWAGRDCPRP